MAQSAQLPREDCIAQRASLNSIKNDFIAHSVNAFDTKHDPIATGSKGVDFVLEGFPNCPRVSTIQEGCNDERVEEPKFQWERNVVGPPDIFCLPEVAPGDPSSLQKISLGRGDLRAEIFEVFNNFNSGPGCKSNVSIVGFDVDIYT